MDSIKGLPAPVSTNLVGAEDPSGVLQPLLVDVSGALIVSGGGGGGNSSVGPTGVAVPADATYVAGDDAGNLVGIKVGSDGTVAVSAVSLPLPTGAATEVTLAAVDTNTTNIPNVVSTPGAAIPSRAFMMAGSDGTNARDILTDATGAVQVGGSVTVSGTVAATQSGTWNLNDITGTVSLPTGAATETTLAAVDTNTTNVPNVIGTPGAAIPSRAMVVAGSDGVNVRDILTDATGAVQIGGTVAVSGTVAATQSGTWNINDITGTVSLPTGAATESTLSSVDSSTTVIATNTTAIDTNTTNIPNVIGTPGAAIPSRAIVVAGSDGTNVRDLKTDATGSLQIGGTVAVSGTVAATQSGTWNINDITGTVSLPTGAATQTTLASVNTNTTDIPNVVATPGSPIPSKAFIVAGSDGTNARDIKTDATGVVQVGGTVAISGTVAATQSGTWNINNVSGTVSLPTGAATETTLASINTKTPALGQTTMSGSVPVAIASDQSTLPVTQIARSSSTDALTNVDSTALEASHVIKASAGRLYSLCGVNTGAAQYIQVFNSTTVPANGTAPALLAYVPSGGVFSWDFGDLGMYFSTGIAVSNSSTAATKTIGSANCWFNARLL